MKLKDALKRIEELERLVKELQARPVTQEHHYHYHWVQPQPVLPTYVPVYPWSLPIGPVWISDTGSVGGTAVTISGCDGGQITASGASIMVS